MRSNADSTATGRRPKASRRSGKAFGLDGLDEHAQQFIGPQAKLVAGNPQDAGIAATKHFDARAAANAELLEAMHVVRPAEDAKNGSRLPGGQVLQGDGVDNHDGRAKGRRIISKSSRGYIKFSI
jgi:hypothetical protein